MGNAFDQNAVDVGLSLDTIEEEIEAGIPLHACRLICAYDNEQYYAGKNKEYIPRRPSEEWPDYLVRPKRTSKMTRKAVRELTRHLYSPGPTRKLENGQAEDVWLQAVYQKNNINALMQNADRKATLNSVAAIQAVATGRPEKPIQLYLWGAHEFIVWTYPDDPTEAWAIVTLTLERQMCQGLQQERIRYDAWSRDEHRVYRTKWFTPPGTVGTTAIGHCCFGYLLGNPARFCPDLSGMPEGSGVNPYGALPFSFVHDEPPVSTFHEGGIGTMLREANAEVDRQMSDLAQVVQKYLAPDGFLRNVNPSFRREKKVGGWQLLPPISGAKDGDNNLEPDAFFVQPNIDVEGAWTDIRQFADGALEEIDVPLVAVRDSASTDLSGIAIVSKQVPLLDRTRARQVPFATYENDLASMILTCSGNFYGDPRLLAAGQDTRLMAVYPEPSMPMPTPERDAEDQADLDAGRKSVVQITAERFGITPEQAKEQLERVLDENQWYAELLKAKGLTSPSPIQQPTQLQAEKVGPDDEEDDEDDPPSKSEDDEDDPDEEDEDES